MTEPRASGCTIGAVFLQPAGPRACGKE